MAHVRPVLHPLRFDLFSWLTLAGLVTAGGAALWTGLTAGSVLGLVFGLVLVLGPALPVLGVVRAWRRTRL